MMNKAIVQHSLLPKECVEAMVGDVVGKQTAVNETKRNETKRKNDTALVCFSTTRKRGHHEGKRPQRNLSQVLTRLTIHPALKACRAV